MGHSKKLMMMIWVGLPWLVCKKKKMRRRRRSYPTGFPVDTNRAFEEIDDDDLGRSTMVGMEEEKEEEEEEEEGEERINLKKMRKRKKIKMKMKMNMIMNKNL
ncbi:hypothetical protein ACH5RR_021362 [Cinchona calisaya]|uniref:Uncharacterized protein n=1 Tax=Cinchona calisaya TaxID=153742 RepID=A0ABD2ZHA5_9GENT